MLELQLKLVQSLVGTKCTKSLHESGFALPPDFAGMTADQLVANSFCSLDRD